MPVIALRQIAGAFLCIYFTSMVTIYYWAMIVEQCNHATKDTMNINIDQQAVLSEWWC